MTGDLDELQRLYRAQADELQRWRGDPVARAAHSIARRIRRLVPPRDPVPVPGHGPTVSLVVAAPNRRQAPRWGDWHLAQALARSLALTGHGVRVDTLDSVRPGADVQLVLRGLTPVPRTVGTAQVLWVISHPETLSRQECDDADLVLVASERLADHLASRTSTPVMVMLQATDHRRFHPHPPDPRYRHDVAVVAKSRDVLRPVVRDALAAGLEPALYGTGWEAFLPAGVVAGGYVANADLPVLYSSVGVLLNDHWATMRTWGIVSNRIFDALACGTAVVSDHLPEVGGLFGDLVRTYDDPGSLAATVEAVLADEAPPSERRAARRAAVVPAHTFDHRAGELLTHLRAAGVR